MDSRYISIGMNDEANTLYSQEIDQMTEGMQFILNTVGAIPTVGWHVVCKLHSQIIVVATRNISAITPFFGSTALDMSQC